MLLVSNKHNIYNSTCFIGIGLHCPPSEELLEHNLHLTLVALNPSLFQIPRYANPGDSGSPVYCQEQKVKDAKNLVYAMIVGGPYGCNEPTNMELDYAVNLLIRGNWVTRAINQLKLSRQTEIAVV